MSGPAVELPLHLVTFNLFHDYPFCRHVDRRLEIVAEGIAAEAPDVALLQEISVSQSFGHLPERLVAALRGRGLRYEFFYAPANGSVADGGVFEEGSAILSRWPIIDAAAHRLAPAHRVEREQHGHRYEEFRIAVRATIAVGAAEVDVFGAHVTDAPPDAAGASPRRSQILDLLRCVEERRAREWPAIVGGDFNARPEDEEIRLLAGRGYRDLCADHRVGPTNDPADRDLESPIETATQRIDYLFAGPLGDHEIEVHSAALFLAAPVELEPGRRLWASDHNGLRTRVTVRRSNREIPADR
jgi:endonuclease/exonuclease/phosphatase family metal-dependent hydrolase